MVLKVGFLFYKTYPLAPTSIIATMNSLNINLQPMYFFDGDGASCSGASCSGEGEQPMEETTAAPMEGGETSSEEQSSEGGSCQGAE